VLIPEKIGDLIEQAIYLPMVLAIFERDLLVINKAPFKLNQPYVNLVEHSITAVRQDLKIVNQQLRKEKARVEKIRSDEGFTQYMFFYQGYEQQHNYFNPRLRNRTQELLEHYLYKRFEQH